MLEESSSYYNCTSHDLTINLKKMNQYKIIGQKQSIIFATIGLITAALLVIIILGGNIELITDYPASVPAALSALYISAAVFGRCAGTLIYRFKLQAATSSIVGILLAESVLLTAVLAGSGILFLTNFQDAGAFEDYILKPVVWIMPLGSIVSLILGILYSRRVRKLVQD